MDPDVFHHSGEAVKELNVSQDKLLSYNINPNLHDSKSVFSYHRQVWVREPQVSCVPTTNMQLTPPTTNEDISGLCPMNIVREPIKRLRHCRTFSTRLVSDSETRNFPLSCISWMCSRMSGADSKAALSWAERLFTYPCIAFCNVSSLTGVGNWRFPVCAPAVRIGPADCP